MGWWWSGVVMCVCLFCGGERWIEEGLGRCVYGRTVDDAVADVVHVVPVGVCVCVCVCVCVM
jgi:hypothetical protein